MSDSDTGNLPSEATISRALRDTVIAIHKSGNTDDLTVKRVRTRAEEQLGLPAGFLKTDTSWKRKSHNLIHEAVGKYCTDEPVAEPPAAPLKKSPKPKPVVRKKAKAVSDSARGAKRKAAAPATKPKKRRKTVSAENESESALSDVPDEDDALSDAENEPPNKPTRRRKNIVAGESDEDRDTPKKGTGKGRVDADESEKEAETAPAVKQPEPETRQTPPADTKDNVSESELSSLLDESPMKKKRQKKSLSEKRGKERKPKESKPTKSRAKPSKAKADDDPDQAEIKRLQGWLVKCGIRKVWSKELAKCDTPKEKIRHLKGMLDDVGMEGKYSNEKAARIKEQREFAKDLEEIQKGAMAWGKTEEAEAGGRPRRRLNRGIQRAAVVKKDSDSDSGEDEDASDDAEDEEVKPESEDNDDDGDDSNESE